MTPSAGSPEPTVLRLVLVSYFCLFFHEDNDDGDDVRIVDFISQFIHVPRPTSRLDEQMIFMRKVFAGKTRIICDRAE